MEHHSSETVITDCTDSRTKVITVLYGDILYCIIYIWMNYGKDEWFNGRSIYMYYIYI